jgi:hypothetical protein
MSGGMGVFLHSNEIKPSIYYRQSHRTIVPIIAKIFSLGKSETRKIGKNTPYGVTGVSEGVTKWQAMQVACHLRIFYGFPSR